MTDAIFFDCDGVLVDSEPLSAQTTADLLARKGLHMTWQEANSYFTGKSMADAILLLRDEFGLVMDPSYAKDHETLLFHRFHEGLRPILGIADLLARLPQPVCVTSNSTHRRLAVSLSLTGLDGFFPDRVFSAEDVARGKPAPDLFFFAARRMGVSVDRCLVIDDSPSGIRGAVSAGARAIGFTGGSHITPGHADRLIEAGAQTTVNSIPALSTLLTA